MSRPPARAHVASHKAVEHNMAHAGARLPGGQPDTTPRPIPNPALSRRRFLAGAATVAGASAFASPAMAFPSAEQQLAQLTSRVWDEQLRRFPELAGLPAAGGTRTELNARLSDWSHAARKDWAGWARSVVRRIEAIDATALPQGAEVNRAILLDRFGRIAALAGRYPFGAAAAEPDAPVAPYAISPATGPHRAIAALLLETQPLATRADGEAWLARLAGFPRALDAATEAFRMDAAAGVVPPAFALDAVLAELAALRSPAPAAHPLVTRLASQTAAAGLPDTWAGKAAALVGSALYPALDRQIAALGAVRPQASAAAGAWSLPQGGQFYGDALAWHTGTALSATEVHDLGREQVARLSADMDELLRGLGLAEGTVGQRLHRLGQRPDETYPADAGGRSAVLSAFAAAIERVRPRLPDLFAVPAPAQLAVEPLPAPLARERSEACLLGGQVAGTRPGTVYLNLQDLGAWPRYCIASTAFHGSIPAHVWEGAAASSAEDLPAIRKCGLRYAACADGWSLYAEQVADEQGLYARDTASRLGYLRTQLLHAARLVADTGVNDRRWTIDRAAGWLADATGLDAPAARREAEAMAVMPGRACAHAVGRAEWLRLRELARRVGGTGYDQRRFHQLIRFGEAPFAVIEGLVTTTFTRRRSVLVTRMV